jgi:hypothetical protein
MANSEAFWGVKKLRAINLYMGAGLHAYCKAKTKQRQSNFGQMDGELN